MKNSFYSQSYGMYTKKNINNTTNPSYPYTYNNSGLFYCAPCNIRIFKTKFGPLSVTFSNLGRFAIGGYVKEDHKINLKRSSFKIFLNVGSLTKFSRSESLLSKYISYFSTRTIMMLFEKNARGRKGEPLIPYLLV